MVITFNGISEIKAAQQEIQAARAYSDSIIATIIEPLVVLDEELRVISASSSFYRVFAVTPKATVGRHLPEAGDHLEVPALREFLASLPAEGALAKDAEIAITLPALGRRVVGHERACHSRRAISKAENAGGNRRCYRGEAR